MVTEDLHGRAWPGWDWTCFPRPAAPGLSVAHISHHQWRKVLSLHFTFSGMAAPCLGMLSMHFPLQPDSAVHQLGCEEAPPLLNSPETRVTRTASTLPRELFDLHLSCWPGALQAREQTWFSDCSGRCHMSAHPRWTRLSRCPLHLPEVINILVALCSYHLRPIPLWCSSFQLFNCSDSLSKLQPSAFSLHSLLFAILIKGQSF